MFGIQRDTFAKTFLAPALGRAGGGAGAYAQKSGPRWPLKFGHPLLTPSPCMGVERGCPAAGVGRFPLPAWKGSAVDVPQSAAAGAAIA